MQRRNFIIVTLTTILSVTVSVSCEKNNEEVLVRASENQTEKVAVSQEMQVNAQQKNSSIDAQDKLRKLAAIIPQKPTIIDNAEVVRIMRQAAETRQDEALSLLIKSLAFNYDPDASNERKTIEELIPAIGIIREYFGEKSGEALYQEAVSSNEKWLRDRIALVVRVILSEEKREYLNARFFDASSNLTANDFARSLVDKNLQIQLARREDNVIRGIDDKIKQLRDNKKPK